MGCQSETPAFFNPEASRAAFQRGTAEDTGESGETDPVSSESLPQGDSGHEPGAGGKRWLSPLGNLWSKERRMGLRLAVLMWMDRRQWFCHHPRVHHFWEWVVMPEGWGGRLGLRNYIRWLRRKD